jgi:hypothetical protein
MIISYIVEQKIFGCLLTPIKPFRPFRPIVNSGDALIGKDKFVVFGKFVIFNKL